MPTFREAFGASVSYHRRARGISQEELAERSDLDRTYVSGVERGRRNPTLLVIERLAAGVEMLPSELLRDAEILIKGGVLPELVNPPKLLPWRKKRPRSSEAPSQEEGE